MATVAEPAVARRDLLRDLQVAREGDMLQEVAAFAVGRHGDLRPGPAVHFRQLVAARVAGDVDARMVTLGVEPHAAVGETVLQVADRDLVARDHP